MTSALKDEASARLADKLSAADEELSVLNAQYAELAADAGLMAASMLPPPAGTAADLASLAKSLTTGDYAGALFDVIGFVPLIGDAAKGVGKGAKALDRLNDIRKAIDAATAGLARVKEVLKSGNLDEMAEVLERTGDLMSVRKAAAKSYWADVAEAGRKRYDDAIKNCSTQKCRDEAILLKGDHYQYTPKNGGTWRNGTRGDGDWTPDSDSAASKAIAQFNQKFRKGLPPVESIPYRNGHPDFGDLVPTTPSGGKASVEIAQTGDNNIDFALADEALRKATGYDQVALEKKTGMRFTWHHAPDGVTMQLVPMQAHGARYRAGHAGGASVVQKEGY